MYGKLDREVKSAFRRRKDCRSPHTLCLLRLRPAGIHAFMSKYRMNW